MFSKLQVMKYLFLITRQNTKLGLHHTSNAEKHILKVLKEVIINLTFIFFFLQNVICIEISFEEKISYIFYWKKFCLVFTVWCL